MSSLVTTQYIFLSSANADKDPDNANVSIDIPEDSLRARNNEYVKLTLVQHNMINAIRNVPPGNTVRINADTFSLPPGSYRICDVVDAFNTRLSTLQVSHLATQNRMEFRNSGPDASVEFSEDLSFLFGLRPGAAVIAVPTGAAVTSPDVVVPQRISELVIAVRGVIPGPPQNMANLSRDGMVYSDVIGIVPLRAAPNTLNVFTNSAGAFEVNLYDPDVQVLGFRILDINRQPVQGLPDWSAVIRVDVFRRIDLDPVSQRLDRIIRYLELFALMAAADRADASLPAVTDGEFSVVAPVYAGNRL